MHKMDNQKNAPGSRSSSVNVNSEIDDYIESLWRLVMTRWENTNGLLVGPRIHQQDIHRQLSEELKRLTNLSEQKRMRTKSVAPKGLKFIIKEEEAMAWAPLEKRFEDLTKYTDGLLPRSCFWECIGMNKDSQEFAEELFDLLTLRRNIVGDLIDKEQMKHFWGQISGQSFDSRLQTFFDMIDKDEDGRITQDDVRKIISLSASINKLSNIKNQADEYATFIMEELDPNDLGYIMIDDLEMLLLQSPKHDVSPESNVLSHMLSQQLKTTQSGNPIRRCFRKVLINSPYGGAPAQYYKKYEVVLLVGSGTPIINILKDILINIKAKEGEDNALENGSTSKLQKKKSGRTNFKTTRAYFYWVTNELGSFDMVKDIIYEADEIDKYGVIDMYAYCTSVFEEDDARSTFIAILQSLYHARNGIDVVSGTRVKSRFSEPNWRDVYKQIALNHVGSRIGVFYCGEPAPQKELKQLARDFSLKTSTKFDFHKQNF